MARVFEKEPRCFLEAAAGVEQNVFARNFNSHPKVVVLLQIINNHVGKVMHVDDHFANPKLAQAVECDLQQRVTSHFHECFRAFVGERTQSRTEAGSQNHGLHCPARSGLARSGSSFSAPGASGSIFSSSRCLTTTSMPFRPCRRFATCSAKYTERCCPPVHPNDTMRFLNPRR